MASSNLPDDMASRSETWTTDALGNHTSIGSTTTTPPGFVSQGLWSENSAIAPADGVGTPLTGGQPQAERRRNERTSSLNNIAAVLGNGLADSMEDATRGDHLTKSHLENDLGRDHNQVNNSNGPTNLTDNFFNPSNNNDMTYERHKRHAASRLLKASGLSNSSPISRKAPEAGSLFEVLDPAVAHTQSFSNRSRGNQASINSDDVNNRNVDSRRSGGIGTQSMVPSPFSQNPAAAPFQPSYDPTSINNSLQLNNNQSQNTRDQQRNDHHGKSRLPVTKDLGCTVMEPSDAMYGSGGGASIQTHDISSYASNRNGKSDVDLTYGIQSDMKNLNLWSESGSGNRGGRDGGRDLKQPSPSRPMEPNDSAIGVGGGDRRHGSPPQVVDAEDELRPFTWDTNHHEPSRTLAILNVSSTPPNEIISLCENFGQPESYRSEFLERVGVFFVSYSDMRCAQFAAMQLPGMLQRSAGGGRVQVKFCVPLNSSSQNDESMVVINDLPNHVGVDNLARILSSFGAIRSLKNIGDGTYGDSFLAEFHDVQDARKVVFELESSQPWGADVSIEVGSRNSTDRKKGRELLAMLGRWRNQGGGGQGQGRPVNRGREGGNMSEIYRPHTDSRAMGHRDGRYERGLPHEKAPLNMYSPPDGRYSYGGNTYVMQHQQHSGYPSYRHHNDHVVHGGHGHHGNYMNRQVNHQPLPHQQQYYQPPQQMSHGNFHGGSSVVSGGSSRHTGTSGYYTDDRSIGSHNSNLRSVNSLVDSMAGNTRDGQSQHLILDLDAVENGVDTRTSLMVRNIPNKYTQQMLLTEFTENDHGPGIIDFFYLPIDFKNRCNRGYAFINFVDHRDILNFHRQYYGQHWRTFNSDKICDITYARIQGKAAMLKRFENSALMEKDEEYKPLVFVSNGPERGTRLPFPDSSRGS